MPKITAKGFETTTQNEYFAQQSQLYYDIDPQFNIDPSTPDGLKIAHDAEVFSALTELVHQAYLSKDPATATNRDLDVVANITDTKRGQGTRSTVLLKLTGVYGTIVDRGKRVSSQTTGQRWVLSQGVMIDVNGEAWVEAYSERVGMIEASAGTITSIVDSVGGWQAVTNPNIATVGRNPQSDGQLRLSRLQQLAAHGNSQVDALRSAIYTVKDVRRCEVYENDTAVVDAIGLPAHSVCYLVDGGDEEEIARAIYSKRSPGTAQFVESSTTIVERDVPSLQFPQSTPIKIKFARPKYIDINMVVTIKNDGTLPENAAFLIREAIMEFTNGELLTQDIGFKQNGFAIGESVPISTMMTPVNKIIGSFGNSYIESLSINDVTSGTVAITPFQLSRWVSSGVEVKIV